MYECVSWASSASLCSMLLIPKLFSLTYSQVPAQFGGPPGGDGPACTSPARACIAEQHSEQGKSRPSPLFGRRCTCSAASSEQGVPPSGTAVRTERQGMKRLQERRLLVAGHGLQGSGAAARRLRPQTCLAVSHCAGHDGGRRARSRRRRAVGPAGEEGGAGAAWRQPLRGHTRHSGDGVGCLALRWWSGRNPVDVDHTYLRGEHHGAMPPASVRTKQRTHFSRGARR